MPFPDPAPGYRTQYAARSDAPRPLARRRWLVRQVVAALLAGLLVLAVRHGWLVLSFNWR